MKYTDQTFDEERALYAVSDSLIENCRFDGPADGESALKETHDIEVRKSFFNLRYPFWHVTNGKIFDSELTENCRAALWYDNNILIEGCHLNGIKALRECDTITIKNSTANSPEFIWKCRNLHIENLTIEQSEYPFFEVETAKIEKLKMKGKYSFQYCSNIEITNSELDTKDAFWHSKNVTVRDSVIKGEYLGWYSENLTLINCRITGTQPFCYCKNLVLENCTMENCDLSFEKSTVQVSVKGKIDSVKNPLSGKIEADCIGEIILDDSITDVSKTKIICHKRPSQNCFKCA
ncbi:DUF3737 family protein [Treponema sp.]|uniref:DUF3737 family protein n=1 Tax=Treponema sp. TaxID=166 RepID=UPI00388DDFD5